MTLPVDALAVPLHSWLRLQREAVPLDVETACYAAGAQPGGERIGSGPRIVERAEQEMRAAALWSKQQLEQNPAAMIGIIVPNLGQCRDQVERVFVEVFEPLAALPDLARLMADIPAVVDTVLTMRDSERQSFCPMLAILSARHETQYSRLFRS